MARLAPGVDVRSRERAARRREPASWWQTVPPLPDDFTLRVSPVEREVLGPFRPAVLMLLWAVGLLLLLACANVAGLLLAHAESRRREFAVRAALGAAPARLARQVITESLILGALGGLAGTLLGFGALRVLLALSPPGLPRVDEVSLNPVVLAFAVLASLVTALLFGLAPAAAIRRRDAQVGAPKRRTGRHLRSRAAPRPARPGVRRNRACRHPRRRGRARGANLAQRRPHRPGIRARPACSPSSSRFRSAVRGPRGALAFLSVGGLDLAAIPGVRAAGGVSALPLSDEAGDWGFLIEGRPPVREGERNPFADRIVVTPGYFEAMRVPLKAGRLVTPEDDGIHEQVILINEKTAKRYWPDGDALGSRIRLSSNVDTLWRRVIGIVGDVRSRGLEAEARQEFYFPHAQYPTGTGNAPGHDELRVAGRPARRSP